VELPVDWIQDDGLDQIFQETCERAYRERATNSYVRVSMRTLVLSALLAFTVTFVNGQAPRLTGGTGTIYMGSYAKRIMAVDEATEKLIAEIPLTTGIPWSMALSLDGTRFYIENVDLEHFEVVDVAARKSIDSFTLSEGNQKVRGLSFAPDPQNRVVTILARTATKLPDRFEIGSPTLMQYDLRERRVIRTAQWTRDPEPGYGLLRYSPDGKLIYAFSDEIVAFDAQTLQEVASWNLALPNEPRLGRFDPGALDLTNDEPGYFNGLFTLKEPVQKRSLLVVGRINFGQKSLDFFPIGPAPDHGEVSFAFGADRKHGYVLVQDIQRYELWTIDIPGRKLLNRVEFRGRPRMAIRTSSNGKLIYLYEAGNTIDLYDAEHFTYLRTITLDADMTSDSFHVVAPRPRPRSPVNPPL
jgi:hypothetical protein